MNPFLKKFEGRYEKIGAGGIKKVPLKDSVEGQIIFINKKKEKDNPLNYRINNQKMFSRMMNQYNASMTEDSKRIGLTRKNPNTILMKDNNSLDSNIYQNHQNNIINNDINNNFIINNNIKENKNKNIVNNNSLKNGQNYLNNNFANQYIENTENKNNYKLKNNNSYPIFESMNYDDNSKNEMDKLSVIENERFYKPYSLKEYKHIMEDYNNNRFGGLGKNMNKEWKEREKRFNKVKKLENSVIKKFNEKVKRFDYKKIESPQKMNLIKLGQQIMNSKRYMAQKYGKRIVLNKVSDKIKKEKFENSKMKEFKENEKYLRSREFKRKQKDEDIVNIYDNIIRDKNDNYMDKLMEIKSSLI